MFYIAIQLSHMCVTQLTQLTKYVMCMSSFIISTSFIFIKEIYMW